MIEKINIFLKFFRAKKSFYLGFLDEENYATHRKDGKFSISRDRYTINHNIKINKNFMILLRTNYKIEYKERW